MQQQIHWVNKDTIIYSNYDYSVRNVHNIYARCTKSWAKNILNYGNDSVFYHIFMIPMTSKWQLLL